MAAIPPILEPGEILVTDGTNDAEFLWRQVHPIYVDGNGRVTEQAFQPNSSDKRRLSCSRGNGQTPEGAHDFHTQVLGLASAGTWGVLIGEVRQEQVHAVDDSQVQKQDPPTPGHTYVDYRGLDKNGRAFVRDALADYANEHKVQYAP